MAANVEGDCCSICLGEYKDPRILPCQHVFCLQCLCDYVAEMKQINCPNCMTEVEIPTKGVAALLKYVEEPLEDSTEPCEEPTEPCEEPTEREVCTVCEKGIQASFQCFECDKYMCDVCKKFHDVFSSKHQVHTLQESDSEKSFCENHPKVLLQFYCKTCKCLICQQCMDDGHDSSFDKHFIFGVEDFLMEKKKTFEDYRKNIDEKLQRNSGVIDRFIYKETMQFNGVMERIPKLEANLKACKEKAGHRKKIFTEDDEILSKKLTAAIKHLDKPSNKSENIQELIDLSLNLESKIKVYPVHVSHTDIDDIDYEMGTLDATMGRLFSFQYQGAKFESKVFFVGDIHWTVSVTAQHSEKSKDVSVNRPRRRRKHANYIPEEEIYGDEFEDYYYEDRYVTTKETWYESSITLTLNSFIKEEDQQLVESVTTDLVCTYKVDSKNSVVNKQSKTFSVSPNASPYDNTSSAKLECKLLLFHQDSITGENCLQILFDIKEIKYKNNIKYSLPGKVTYAQWQLCLKN